MGRLTWLDTVDSTQDALLRLLNGPAGPSRTEGTTPAPAHGDALATADQRSGRGRHGRVWAAPPGSSLALSVLLRPAGPSGPLAPAHWSWLSLVAASAVAGLLAGRGAPTHVKWPNDVLAEDGRKLCGVLATVAPGGGVVVGTGVNLAFPAGPPAATATALADWVPAAAVPSPQALAEELLAAVVTAADAFAAALDGVADPVDGTHLAVAPVAARLSTPGRSVRAELPDGTALEGEAVGLGPGGVLRVRTGGGGRETLETEISAGDVVHLRGDVRRGR